MRNISGRIEKLENKVQSIKAEAVNRQAKLLEIQHLEKTDPLKALFLRAELEYERKVTLVDLIVSAHKESEKDFSKV
jgi:hypothetical protein